MKKLKIRKVLKRVRHKLGLTGVQIKKRLGLKAQNSAQSVVLADYGHPIYGSTGSIVGRY